MRGLQKPKRVSWASDLNLCQVKLFLSDESPSQVGLSGQDHLQAKASWPSHSGGAGSDDNLPPGFEGIQPANLLQNKLSQIPLIQWKCPSRFALDPNWQVAAGEESKELEVESQREMRVLEAVYPRPSAIPTNPASPMGTDELYYNDQHTPLIPITPIEDEDMAPDSSSMAAAANTSLQAPATTEPDVVSAAYSALNAAMSNGSQGRLIDPNLLIKILSNPTLIEKLVSSTQGPSTSGSQISQALSMPTLPAMSVAEPPPPPPPPPPVHARTTHLPFSTTASSSSSSGHYPPASRVGPGPVSVPVSNLPPPPPPAEVNPGKKDINYYKSLIQQHGGEKAEAVNNNNNNNVVVKTRGDMKGKIMKPCIYYNSPRGCRHGANCVFQHDSSFSSQQQQQQQQRVSNSSSGSNSSSNGLPDAKRMKMDSREISGT